MEYIVEKHDMSCKNKLQAGVWGLYIFSVFWTVTKQSDQSLYETHSFILKNAKCKSIALFRNVGKDILTNQAQPPASQPTL